MPPHQPVPMMPTPICLIARVSFRRSTGTPEDANAMPLRRRCLLIRTPRIARHQSRFAILGMLFQHASCRVHGFCRIVPSGTASRFQLDMPICYPWASGPKVLASMQLRSIQYFVQVADEGSITRTADKIGIAQPALTRHVKQLEAELGIQLLMRLPRGVRLTSAGREFLDHARRIMLEVARAREHVRGKAQSPRGTVV